MRLKASVTASPRKSLKISRCPTLLRTFNRFSLASITALIFLMVVPLQGTAADGISEINQTCVTSGCFPGDSAGFPIEISEGGSYVLTGNLDVRAEPDPENITAISISVPASAIDGVVLDLNGFRIIGPNECFGGTPVTTCTNPGTGIGIDSNDNQVVVKNGIIHGMGGLCIDLISAARIENMHLVHCGGGGVQASTGQFFNNYIGFNGGDGIDAGSGLAIGNYIRGNMNVGLSGSNGMGFSNNTFEDNGTNATGTQLGPNLCNAALC